MTTRLERTNLLQYREPSGNIRVGDTLHHWDRRRTQILLGMQEVTGPLPDDSRRCPLNITIEEEVDCGTYLRQLITYSSEPNSRTPAYLLIPRSARRGETTASGILALHSTDLDLGHKVVVGMGRLENRDYAHQLAEQGYVVIAPSYPLMAHYQPDIDALGYVSGTMKAIWDNIRALDVLDTLPYVDHSSYGAIGHSLGGHNAIYTAVFEPRIKVIASSCGFDSFLVYMGGNLSGWTQHRYMPRLADYAREDIPFDFHELVGALAPRPFFVSAPLHDGNFKWQSVDEITSSARAIYELYGASENLQVRHPDVAHDLPDEILHEMFSFFHKHLHSPASKP